MPHPPARRRRPRSVVSLTADLPRVASTAFLARALGAVALRMQPELVALHESRGIETPATKVLRRPPPPQPPAAPGRDLPPRRAQAFMRATVLVADLALYIPAACALAYCLLTAARAARRAAKSGPSDARAPRPAPHAVTTGALLAREHADSGLAAMPLLLLPALVVIDHGHFQVRLSARGAGLSPMMIVVPRVRCARGASTTASASGCACWPCCVCYTVRARGWAGRDGEGPVASAALRGDVPR